MNRIYVNRETATLERTDLYHVRLVLRDGEPIEDLEPRRLFPFSNTTQYISLLDRDEKEIALIRDVEDLDDASREALNACFSEYYMIPEIRQLISSVDKFGSLTWEVETDRGRVTFRIRNRHSDIKHFRGSGRVIVRDFNDNRYEIKDYRTMDAHSQALLFSYL